MLWFRESWLVVPALGRKLFCLFVSRVHQNTSNLRNLEVISVSEIYSSRTGGMPPKRRKPLEESSSASSGNAAGSGGPSILEELSAEEKKRIRSQYRKLHQEVLDRQREGPTRGDEDEDTFTRLTNYLGDMNVIFEVRLMFQCKLPYIHDLSSYQRY